MMPINCVCCPESFRELKGGIWRCRRNSEYKVIENEFDLDKPEWCPLKNEVLK